MRLSVANDFVLSQFNCRPPGTFKAQMKHPISIVDREPHPKDTVDLSMHCYRCSQTIIVIVIIISKLLKRYSKAKRTRAPAYSRALRQIKGGFPKGGQEKLRSHSA